MENTKKIKISIIILSWNTKALLKQCLDSLINANIIRANSNKNSFKFENYEIIVVDNGSTDGSPEMVKEFAKKHSCLFVIENRSNLGFAKGNNQGIRAATGDLIMLLNSDTVVQKGAIEKLAEVLTKDTPLYAASPLLLLPNGKPQIDYYMKFPNLWQIFFYHNPILRPVVMKTPLRRLVISSRSHSWGVIGSHLPFEVGQLPGAALMAKKEVWEKVGLLDEDYQFLYEDVDWCWRARKMGYKLAVVPEAKIIHLGGASWKQKLKDDSYEFYRQYFSSMLLFVKKNYGEGKLKVFRTALVVNFLIQFKFKLGRYFLLNKGVSFVSSLWQ